MIKLIKDNKMILSCSCKSDRYGNKTSAIYQDNKYGEGMRVHNKLMKSKTIKTLYRCTICGHERSI